ncbi:acetolactate decarboxylase, partial [Mariniflexile gromovii]|uniref:acetolactate decarboxylase n=1 Tax=Mariniflexile gromovii TaxID=362523 RepID=UPI00363FAF78
ARLSLLLLLLFISCVSKTDENKIQDPILYKDTFYQYNIWWGFVNKVFDGDLTVKELKKRGDIGLGSYTQLDGELIMLDGIPYRVREDGSVTIPNDDEKIVYVDAAFFEPDFSFQINQNVDFDSLREIINTKLPTLNQFYSLKIKGNFDYIKCGGLNKQEKPYTEGLDVLIPERPVFEGTHVKGTIVGFYCPEFIGNINVAGYHFHFISDDKKLGGHVMSFKAKNLLVEVDPLLNYNFTIPGSDDFFNVTLDKEFQYGKN